MKNAVVMLVYSRTAEQLALTKAAVVSALAQDIPGGVHLWVINNGSDAATVEYLDSVAASLGSDQVTIENHATNGPPTTRSNRTLATVYGLGYEKILGLPNDVVLPPNLYTQLDRWPRGVVTATMTGDNPPPTVNEAVAVLTHTPMAVALVRKWAWQALIDKEGFFYDERMELYASDCDLALRFCACGVVGVQLDIPYYHYSSASWRLAPEEDQRKQLTQADADRSAFWMKWGFRVEDPEYQEYAADINFLGKGGDA